jgi:small subunit ribosomal protein S3Ae
MAIGKNKKLGKKGRGRKKAVDPFSKKEWYEVRAPNMFTKRDVGWTVATKSQGKKLARETLIHRVIQVSLGDLKVEGEEDYFRQFKLRVNAIQGKQCLTNFHGMDMATDKLKSLVRKWHTLIEANCEVKTTDGYILRLFCIGFTKRRPNQNPLRKTSYAQTAQIKTLRRKMIEIMTRESQCELSELVKKFIPETIGEEIVKVAEGIYPLNNVFIRKVKMLKAPKTDLSKLLELHEGADVVMAVPVEREPEAAADDE